MSGGGRIADLGPCPFCGGEIVPHWPRASVWRCRSCRLGFRTPTPSEAELAALYEKSWKHPEASHSETGATDLQLARIYAAKLARSLGREDFRALSILDFGAGSGAMSLALAEQGAEVDSLDPFGYEELVARGLRSLRSLDDLPPGRRYDGVVALDVIEHLRSPWDELARLRGLLSDSGWLYLSTANAHSLNARLTRGSWREAGKAGHLVFFTPGSLEAVLRRSGYRGCRRLIWLVAYKPNFLRRTLQYGLQATRLEGGLRYLAFTNGADARLTAGVQRGVAP